MKLALHRSITFWSGLLVMGFIVWAWQDSRVRHSGAVYQEWSLSNSPDGLRLYRTPGTPGRKWEAQRERISDTFRKIPRQWLPAPFFVGGGGEYEASTSDLKPTLGEWYHAWMRAQPTEAFMVYLPHWLLLLAVAVPWLALLYLRAKRRKQKA